eukprot:jgi/Tetstr1/464800/TSEL_009539.t1
MSTSINTGMMNTSLANLARQSAIKTDPGDAPPPPHFRDDTSSSDDAFSMDETSDSDSGDIQHIKPAAVKPTLNLKNVPIWDNTISTRDNAQAIKIALGSAAYLDTTKGKGTRQLPNEPVQVYVRRCRNLWNLLRKAHGQWTFEYVAINYLIPGLHPAYDHIVDATIPATNVTKRLATILIISSFGACNIVHAECCGSEVHRDTLLWTIITQPQDIRNCGNNVAAIKLADPCPFSGCRIYNPAAGRKTPPLSMPAFQFSNAAYLMDAFQPSGQQEGLHAPPPMLPSAALASAQEGPPPPHHNEQHPPHHQEGDATALSAPHTRKEAQLTSHYVDLSDYHPTLVASAIAAVSMNHEINSITTMALFVWVNVPELRRDNESHVIQQTAWAFAAQHEDGDIKREAGVIVRGNLLTTGETYAYD